MNTSIGLTRLPYELEENIITYLSDMDLTNYCQTNKKSMNICDFYVRIKAQKENIPLKLLPANNVINRYIELKKIKRTLECRKYTAYSCFKKAILNNNLREVKWLTNLLILGNMSNHQKPKDLAQSSWYAFENNKDDIGKWLLYYLSKELKENLNNIAVNLYLRYIIDDSLKKNKMDVIYYVLNNYIDSKSIILTKLALINDLNNLSIVINNYDLSYVEYNGAIINIIEKQFHDKNPEYLLTIEFLLKHYPGDKDNLYDLLGDYDGIYPGKDVFPILIKYGLNNYSFICGKISRESNPKPDTLETFKWILLNYGNQISKDTLLRLYNSVFSIEVGKIISEYLSHY